MTWNVKIIDQFQFLHMRAVQPQIVHKGPLLNNLKVMKR